MTSDAERRSAEAWVRAVADGSGLPLDQDRTGPLAAAAAGLLRAARDLERLLQPETEPAAVFRHRPRP